MSQTPLYARHLALNGQMIDFGGWLLPVQYQSILQEHRQTRNAAGLFDVSHMGEIAVTGTDALEFLQRMVTNDITNMKELQAIYTPMCNENGGTVDDLLIYKLGANDFLLVVNAANTAKAYEWLKAHQKGCVQLTNVSDDYAQLSIQGPFAEQILQRLCQVPLMSIPFYHLKTHVRIADIDAIVSRTGYTGEDGFELYVPSGKAIAVWDALMEAGNADGLTPAGLGARDSLRLEAALPLYGHELTDSISPLEAGLGLFVKLQKDDFIGKQALATQKINGLQRRIVGFEMSDRCIARAQTDVQIDGQTVGIVTSGGFAPSIGKNVGLALINTDYSAEGTALDIMIRSKPAKAFVAKKPFYSKRYKK